MADVGINPSVTKAMHEIHLDMHVKLLDYFGTIFVSSKNDETFATFRNCTKIERLTYPIFIQNQSKPTNR